MNAEKLIEYKGIFNKNTDLKETEVLNILSNKSSYIDNLQFDKKIPILYKKNATAIFVNFDMLSSSNFIYQNGDYYHFKNKIKDIDSCNNKSIKVSNVIVQYINEKNIENSIDNISGKGTGILFSYGKASYINWLKSKDNPIQLTDTKGNFLSLISGPTWYIIINKTSSVVYN